MTKQTMQLNDIKPNKDVPTYRKYQIDALNKNPSIIFFRQKSISLIRNRISIMTRNCGFMVAKSHLGFHYQLVPKNSAST